MANLIFSLNATLPVFLLMVTGYFLHKIGWIDDDFASKMNTFVFRLALPVLVFRQLAETNFYEAWDTKFVLFCFAATLLSIIIVGVISTLLKDKSERGEFIQASYRSSAALLGVAYIQNIYGNTTMGALMILGAVPLYNIMAVVVLSLTDPLNGKLDKKVLKKTIKGILTNPIIIGIVLGILYSLIRLPMPTFFDNFLNKLGVLSSPLGLMAMGAGIDFAKIDGKIRPAILATFIKLIGLECLFLPFAVMMGFRTEKLVAIMIMLGSATTVSSYVMAKNMHHEGTLTSITVGLTTVFVSFSLTFWIFIARSMGLI